MELEEAIEQCKKFIQAFKKDDTKSVTGFDVKAVEIVLQELKNSIPKKKIEDKINKLDLEIDEEYEKSMAYHQLVYARCELKELLEEK